MSSTLRSQRGQTIIEFALMLPLLMMIIVGIIDFSVLFYDKAVVTNASREGARQGSIFRSHPTTGAYTPLPTTGNPSVSQAVTNYVTGRALTFGSPGLQPTNVEWSLTSPPTSWGSTPPSVSGGSIKVVVTYRYTFLAVSRLIGWGNTMDISAETIMRME